MKLKMADDMNGHCDKIDESEADIITEDTGPPTDNQRDATSALSRKKQKLHEIVLRQIAEAKALGAVSLDLCNRSLKKIPAELLELTQLEYLYLENNDMTCLPDNFFDCLPNLSWLDLRRNYLASLPSAYIGRHNSLRTLLLEGNELRTLPLEIGLIPTLHGLNLSNNPLEFPPQEVLERGTPTIMAFFREMLRAKSQGRVTSMPQVQDLKVGESDESDTEESFRGSNYHSKSLTSSSKHMSSAGQKETSASTRQHSQGGEFSDLVGPVPQTASLHQPASYNDMKSIQAERLRRSGVLPGREKSKKMSPESKQRPRQESTITQERVEKKYLEEKRLARLRDLKEKQEMVLQRRRDAEVLKEWRDEGKDLQRKKTREKMIHGKIDFDEAIIHAPYGYDDNRLKMMTNEERIAEDVRKEHEKISRALSPASLQKRKDARKQRDQALDRRIKDHTTSMVNRKQAVKGTPQEEMEAAQKELQIAEQLKSEVARRRKELEYRFTAFTGDVTYQPSKAATKY